MENVETKRITNYKTVSCDEMSEQIKILSNTW